MITRRALTATASPAESSRFSKIATATAVTIGNAVLEGLAFPTGVMAWRKGALISGPRDHLRRRHQRRRQGRHPAHLFRGFATENYQARVNGLSYGIDNWVYGANGLIGGTIHGMASGREFNIGGRDFRFKPDTGEFEPASGLTQQGRVHDDWGNQFGGNNSVLIQHYPLPDHYARRNPRVAAPGPSVALAGDAEPSRLFRPAARWHGIIIPKAPTMSHRLAAP